MEPVLPKPEGTRYLGPAVDSRGLVRKYPLPLGQAESLVAMTAEYRFFTPAMLYLHGLMTDAPLIDLMCELRRDIRLLHHKFNRPLFSGLVTRRGDTDWNHVLWAVRNEDWNVLADFVVSLTMSARSHGLLLRYAEQELTIIDPLVVDRAVIVRNVPPLLDITAFGVNGNRCRIFLRHDSEQPASLPRLCFGRPEDEVQVFAAAYVADRNPIHVRDHYRWRKQADKETQGSE